MAAVPAAKTGQKRGPGRPARDVATPAAKRLKTTATVPTPASLAKPDTHSPAIGSPGPARRVHRLPAKLSTSDNKPLPTLPEPQPPALPDDEFHSIAASAVLAGALERSRLRWTCHGVFQKHWVKPETGKNAKPPPPNNPDVKSMKCKGECRIRLEPHVFTADVYVEERAKVAPVPKQFGVYGQQYRPPQHPQPPYQGRPLQPGSNLGTPQPHPLSRHVVSPVPEPLQDKKVSPDPVISMLASRASSDPELKGLMKEVATGNATQEQLRVFQKHIDELTEVIKKQKKVEEEQQINAIKYDGAGDTKTPPLSASIPSIQQSPPPPPRVYQAPQQPPAPPYQPPQAVWTPPQTSGPPLILAFKDPGAIEDRFLFPQMSILESLSPQHELVSFMVVKKGREAADPSGLEPDQEYWQPVTMMVEVAYGREDILDCIRKWVRPADEVRKHMETVMQQCRRAPITHLALRLPFKGVAQIESEVASKEATPAGDEKSKSKSGPKSLKKRLSSAADNASPTTPTSKVVDAAELGTSKDPAEPGAIASDVVQNTAESTAEALTVESSDCTNADVNGETGRPRRALRRSVRIEA